MTIRAGELLLLASPFLQRFNALMDLQLSVIKCILNNSRLIGCPNAQLLFRIKLVELFIWTNSEPFIPLSTSGTAACLKCA